MVNQLCAESRHDRAIKYLDIDSDDGVVNHVNEKLLLGFLSYSHVAQKVIESCFNDALVMVSDFFGFLYNAYLEPIFHCLGRVVAPCMEEVIDGAVTQLRWLCIISCLRYSGNGACNNLVDVGQGPSFPSEGTNARDLGLGRHIRVQEPSV